MNEHHIITDELILQGKFTRFFGSGPHGCAGDQFSITFAIAEEDANAYVRRIRSARKAERVLSATQTS